MCKKLLQKLKNPKLIYPLIMAPSMALIMSGVMTLIHFGLIEGFGKIWMKSFSVAVCVAFVSMAILAPQVQKLVNKICNSQSSKKLK